MDPQPAYGRKERFKFWLASQVAARLLRLLFRTCRNRILRPDLVEKFFDAGKPGIGVTWHRGAIYFLYFFGAQHPAIMISRSRDGEYLARYLKIMGGVPVRGSSSRGGLAALKEMADYLRDHPDGYAATVADGPRGPSCRAKKGMIALAARTGLPLVPMMWSSNQVWVLKKTWDRTMIPKPFAKVVLTAGREFHYPPDIKGEELEQARQELEDELNRIKDELDAITGYKEPA
ncbi:MAG: lysophospholipid acyltransferase family protein [Desulfarculaceae bacterium]|nr:lysophospholipid acyltransferase family protein [Desulfarculaceae bacterium]MCF8072412.1 lysophospholipid acyltransferase family protein [Desulfarculaceae bacterium]MCF8100333.1 lysophospholipid acyltransferase family protein [Desulfarculaceae bacterium]MCF8117552.1 lysophospholipid acyltransferase family protein [Desulfarculaceae bacterium]